MDAWTRVSWPLEKRFSTKGLGVGGGGLGASRVRN